MSEFDEIRPYNDDEVSSVIARLMSDNEFIDAIARLKLPKWLAKFALLFRPYVRGLLSKEVQDVKTVQDFQSRIENYLERLLNTTVTQWTVSGLDRLSRDKSYLFVSNHRDISMDPAFVNWALYKNGFSTLRIAIGDNLLTKPFASDLMRLNKSFIVNRSATAPREKFKAAKLLSRYIRHSIQQDNENVWIAQREGRAKDGKDKTNSAIINMFALSKEKPVDIAEHIQNLNIVPVSISYEYDPCDTAKARELYLKQSQGSYEKDEHEDVQSIAKGITGFKGHVHLSFGTPLAGEFENTDAVTDEIDQQILSQYVLHPTNCFAYELLEKKSPRVKVTANQVDFTETNFDEARAKFIAHINECDESYRTVMLEAYANPVYASLAAH